MNSCLPKIGIRGLCESDSDLYLNDLPGITLCNISAITTEEHPSILDWFNSTEKMAERMVKKDFLSKLSKHYQFNTIIESIDKGGVGYGDECCTDLVNVKIRNRSTEKFSVLKNISLEFNLGSPWKGCIEVYTSCGVENVCVDLKCGYNRVQLPNKIKDCEITISIAPLDSYILVGACKSATSCGCTKSCFCKHSCVEIDIEDREGNALSDAVRVCVDCGCDSEPFICHFAEELDMAKLYMMGIMMMEEIITSTRGNPLVRTGKDIAAYNIVKWQGGMNTTTGESVTGKYWTSLGQAVKQGINLAGRLNSVCVSSKRIKVISRV